MPGLQQINIAVTIAGQVSEKELEDLVLNLGYEELKISQLEGLDGRFVINGPRIKRNDGETDPVILSFRVEFADLVAVIGAPNG